MIKNGVISEIKANKVKVFYEDISIMTPWIDVAAHVTNLFYGTKVVVALYENDNYRSGIVIGVII
jgi:hypothetical protein